MDGKDQNTFTKYTSQEIFQMGMEHCKRKDREQLPWTIDFWKANPMFGYWLIIIALMILIFIAGVCGFLNF